MATQSKSSKTIPKEKKNFNLKQDKEKHHALWGKNLTVDELQQAKLAIIQYCQQRKFHKEIFALQRLESVNRGSHIIKLCPVLQDEILCVGRRLGHASMPVEAKHPAILPKDHRISDLILQEINKETGHNGHNYILSKLRQKFWIPNANSLIKRILSRYTACHRQHGVTGQQITADLPINRVPPFTRCVVNCFGLFEIKRKRTKVKRYGIIFTCLACRAVHTEVASSLDIDSFINAL